MMSEQKKHRKLLFHRTPDSTPISIRGIILITFTVVSISSVLLTSFVLYQQFEKHSRQMITDSTERLTEQAAMRLENHLTSMREISDALYYDVIKDTDFSQSNVNDAMNTLYEANSNNLVSFALYTNDGKLLSAAPTLLQKEGFDVTKEDWFQSALSNEENLHFSVPHVQNLFDSQTNRYYWVISLSRAVVITTNGVPQEGVLLVDMNYSSIEQMFNEVNDKTNGQYIYLTDSEGEIIYHPHQMQINASLSSENNLQEATYDDGVHEETFQNASRTAITDTIGYAGWKMISVIPSSTFQLGMSSYRYFLIVLIIVIILAIILINRLVANRISSPLTDLDEAIQSAQEGKPLIPEDYDGGSREVQLLGRTLEGYREKNAQLMHDIVIEQEEKRKTELDALQAQINPHFLYNTLDSIVWMIEGGRNKDAVFMVTQLASLFRISLSRGATIITIEDELKHAQNYMNIQTVRFKDNFVVDFDIDPVINPYCTVKLIVQPILENAVYYGVKNMDEDGRIVVKGWKEDDNIYISVEDNGFGMPQEVVDQLLDENNKHVPHHGSGVGLINVHKRIQLRFGQEYGLKIVSEEDHGTKITIHLPAIPYTEENQRLLEQGKTKQENSYEEK
jgi:two-component system sensor histidine kinase YesM